MRGDRPMVEVNGRLWREVDDLASRGPTERVYSVENGNDGATRIVFGDGRSGERLPRGEVAVRVVCYGACGPVDLTAKMPSEPRWRSILILPGTVRLET